VPSRQNLRISPNDEVLVPPRRRECRAVGGLPNVGRRPPSRPPQCHPGTASAPRVDRRNSGDRTDRIGCGEERSERRGSRRASAAGPRRATAAGTATGSRSGSPLRPVLVCEVAFSRLDGHFLRHSAHFVRWRPDKRPEGVARSSCSAQFQSVPVASSTEPRRLPTYPYGLSGPFHLRTTARSAETSSVTWSRSTSQASNTASGSSYRSTS
jgi:hypothetical protein